MLAPVFEAHDKGRVRVARVREGEGPPLILLHGYPDNLQIFSALAPLLAARFQVIAFDWPGMGYSDPWPGGVTPGHLADRLLALLDAWSIERATLVGLDMGGQPALAFAARHPERVDRLVVMNSLVQWDAETSWEIRLLRRFRWNEVILRTLPRVVFARAERTFLPRGTRLPDDLRADLWDSFSRPEVRRTIARRCGGYQGALPRLSLSYPEIRCPALALWAGRDQHFPPVHAERLHAAIPGSSLEILPEAEHWMVWHLAGEVADRILRFAGGPPV
jgi:pimeloyl-ACP methyl ester carboxylesterase